MVVLAIVGAQLVTFIMGYGLVILMLAPLLVGVLFIVSDGKRDEMPEG